MTPYAELLHMVMQAILNPQKPEAQSFLRDRRGFPASRQLAAYQDAYASRLQETILGAYPALLHYLGEKKLRMLARGYIAAHPSRHFNIDRYPVAFSDYVSACAENDMAKDMARLESAVALVHTGEESLPLSAEWIAEQTEASLAAALLKPRASSRLLLLHYDVNAYANALRAGEAPPAPAPYENRLLVYRHNHHVRRLALCEGEYTLLGLLDGATPLADALAHKDFAVFSEKLLHSGEIMQWFARWTHQGCLCQTP